MKRLEVYQYEKIQPGINRSSPLKSTSGIGYREIDGFLKEATPDIIPFDDSGNSEKTLDDLAKGFVFNGGSCLTNQVGQRIDTFKVLGDNPVVMKTRGLSESDFDSLVYKIAREYFRIQ